MGAQVFKPRNGGKVPISLSYVNSKDPWSAPALLLPHQICELLLHKKTYRESLATSLSLLIQYNTTDHTTFQSLIWTEK